MDKSDLIGVADAAELIGVKRRQVNNLIKSGMLPAEKIGNAYVIRRDDLKLVPKNRKPGPKPGNPRVRKIVQPDPFISVEELSKMMDIPLRQATELITSGLFPVHKLGNSYVVRRSSLPKSLWSRAEEK